MQQVSSTAAQILIAIVPLVGIVMGSTVVFFFLLWSHRQKMRLIEQGVSPGAFFDLDSFALLAGLLMTAVGAVLTLFFVLMEGISYVLLGGLIPFSLGTGLLIFCAVRRKSKRE